LVLAPEAYLPLRLVGQHFHAAAEGLGAADRMLTIIETPLPVACGAKVSTPAAAIAVEGVVVRYPDRPESGSAPVTFTARPGTVTALVGPSGGGKSSLLSALLGFVAPSEGRLLVGDVDLADLDLEKWRGSIGWLPQHPRIVDAHLDPEPTIHACVDVGRGLSENDVQAALAAVGLVEEGAALDRRLAADGSGLSVGQRQRLALARAIAGNPDILLLDEPTASLDGDSEARVIEVVQAAARRGAIVIVVAHRPALVDVSDQVVLVAPSSSPGKSLEPIVSVSLPGQRGW